MKQFLVSVYRKFFHKCPECGSPLIWGTPEIRYLPEFAMDPPYHGTFKIVQVDCLHCSWHSVKEKLLNIL